MRVWSFLNETSKQIQKNLGTINSKWSGDQQTSIPGQNANSQTRNRAKSKPRIKIHGNQCTLSITSQCGSVNGIFKYCVVEIVFRRVFISLVIVNLTKSVVHGGHVCTPRDLLGNRVSVIVSKTFTHWSAFCVYMKKIIITIVPVLVKIS